jgi:hypothetical protein
MSNPLHTALTDLGIPEPELNDVYLRVGSGTLSMSGVLFVIPSGETRQGNPGTADTVALSLTTSWQSLSALWEAATGKDWAGDMMTGAQAVGLLASAQSAAVQVRYGQVGSATHALPAGSPIIIGRVSEWVRRQIDRPDRPVNLLTFGTVAVLGNAAAKLPATSTAGRLGISVRNPSATLNVHLFPVATGAAAPTITAANCRTVLRPGEEVFLQYGSGVDLNAQNSADDATSLAVVVEEVGA